MSDTQKFGALRNSAFTHTPDSKQERQNGDISRVRSMETSSDNVDIVSLFDSKMPAYGFISFLHLYSSTFFTKCAVSHESKHIWEAHKTVVLDTSGGTLVLLWRNPVERSISSVHTDQKRCVSNLALFSKTTLSESTVEAQKHSIFILLHNCNLSAQPLWNHRSYHRHRLYDRLHHRTIVITALPRAPTLLWRSWQS